MQTWTGVEEWRMLRMLHNYGGIDGVKDETGA